MLNFYKKAYKYSQFAVSSEIRMNLMSLNSLILLGFAIFVDAVFGNGSHSTISIIQYILNFPLSYSIQADLKNLYSNLIFLIPVTSIVHFKNLGYDGFLFLDCSGGINGCN